MCQFNPNFDFQLNEDDHETMTLVMMNSTEYVKETRMNRRVTSETER